MNQKNITKMLLFVLLIILHIAVVSATEVSNDTTSTDAVGTTGTIGDTVDIDKSVSNKNMKGNLKLSTKTYDVNDFDTLHNALTNNTYDTVNINIKSDITLKNNTNVNDAIKTLNIEGNNKTINGNNTYQFLKITSGTITINNIKIINCNSTYGGAIYNNGGNLRIDNSSFNNNFARYGGAIYNPEGDLKIVNSLFNNNNASVYGGAIHNQEDDLKIVNSLFNNNTAISGGAINNYGCDLKIVNSSFNNNTARVGVIRNYEGVLRIENCSFNNNSVREAGVIDNHRSDFKIVNSLFNNNTARDKGVIRNYEGVLRIENCSFNNNTARDKGVIRNYEGVLRIKNCSFNNNSAREGGVIYNYEGVLRIDNSSFNNNSAREGGVIDNYKGVLRIDNSSFNNNTAIKGGVIYSYYGNVTITFSYFKNNKVNVSGDMMFIEGGNFIAKNNRFISNYHESRGNIITRLVNNTQFVNNIFGEETVFINSMNVINGKYVLTTKVFKEPSLYDGMSYVKVNTGRVSYTLDGKWIGSINVRNESSWIVFDMPSVGNHTVIATYIDRNGKLISTDTFSFEKIAGVNVLLKTFNIKFSENSNPENVILIMGVKDDYGNNINNGRIYYNLNGWIGSTVVKNGSSRINFNYTYEKVIFKATYIDSNNIIPHNIFTKVLDLPVLRYEKGYKNSPQLMINSMNIINGKYVLTTKIRLGNSTVFPGRVSYTLDGKWIGSTYVQHGSSWIVFDMPSVGNHTIAATFIDTDGNPLITDNFTFEKIADINLLFNQISLKDGVATVVNYVKDDHGNNVNNGRVSYSLNGKLIGNTGVKNGSSKINFDYTNTTNTLKATYITNNNTPKNIYTKTLDLNVYS